MLSSGFVPPCVSLSETLCIFKNKGDWRDAINWRPIAMSNSIYRLLMRWVTISSSSLIENLLDPTQFGGRKGRGPGMATLHLLDQIERDGGDYIVFVDLFHAFDTPPKALLVECLQRAGFPPKIVLLLSSVLFLGETRIKSSDIPRFRTSHRNKQGCTVAPLMFVLFFDSVLKKLGMNGIQGTAFMINFSYPCNRISLEQSLQVLQQELANHGMTLNVSKCEIVPCYKTTPPHLTLGDV